LLNIVYAKENINLTEIYSEFTETVTVQYQRTIKIKQRQVNIQQGNPISDIVHSWNKAVNYRDVNTLFNLYAPKVLYYGTELRDKLCVKDKKRFYKKKENSRMKIYPSYLLIGHVYGRLYIFVEGDTVTDRNLLKRYRK